METTYTVHGLDVWGNRRDGFEVNDVYPSQGEVTIDDDANDRGIVRALRRAGFIDRPVRYRLLEITGEAGFSLYIDYNGRPELELRPVYVAARDSDFPFTLETVAL